MTKGHDTQTEMFLFEDFQSSTMIVATYTNHL